MNEANEPTSTSTSSSSSPADVLIALPADEARVVEAVARELGVRPIVVDDRVSLLRAMQEDAPAVAVLDVSPRGDWGGAALGGVLTQESPATRLVYVGPDEDRLQVEALLAGDSYLALPLRAELVRFVLQMALVKSSLARTARYRRSKRLDTKAIQTAALHQMGRRLVAAKTVGEVAEILKSVLGEVLPFEAFAFAGAPEDRRLHLRWYLDRPVPQPALDAARNELLDEIADAVGPFDANLVRTRVYGPVMPAEAAGTDDLEPLLGHTWLLRPDGAERPVGAVAVYRRIAFALPKPVAAFCEELLGLGSLALGRIHAVRSEQVDLLRMMLDSLPDGRLWIEARTPRILANARARQLLGMPKSGPIGRADIIDRLSQAGLYETFFGSMAQGKGRVEAVRTLPGSETPQRIVVFRIRKGLYTIGLLVTFADAPTKEGESSAGAESP